MSVPLAISSKSFQSAYSQVTSQLKSSERIIFDAMVAVSSGGTAVFAPPMTTEEFANKHAEIQRWLETSTIRRAESQALQLFEEIYSLARASSTFDDARLEQVLGATELDTVLHIRIRLSNRLRWVASWAIEYRHHDEVVTMDVYDRAAGEIVPTYVLELLDRAFDAFRRDMATVALALLSIALEATLRDALATRGYTARSGPTTPVFRDLELEVRVTASGYTVDIDGFPARPKSDFESAAGTLGSVVVAVRRAQEAHSGKWRLQLRAPEWFLDFWSSAAVEHEPVKRVTGFGHALRLAREVEHILTPSDLPLDVDPVLQVVRNGTVHLSSTELAPTSDSDTIRRVGDFLREPVAVFDALHTIARFINRQYLQIHGLA